MFATSRSEGFRVSNRKKLFSGLMFFCLLAAAGSAAAEKTDHAGQAGKPGKIDRKVYETYFALPMDLPPGLEARLVAYNGGEDTARVVIEPAAPLRGERYQGILAQGGSKALRFSWIKPGRLIKLLSTTVQVDVQILVTDSNAQLIEAFPFDSEAAERHDYVLPIADSNSACAAANPGSVAANTTLYLASTDVVAPDDYQLAAYSAGGSLLETQDVPAGLLGASIGIALSAVFEPETLDDTRSVRVISEDEFTGFGLAEVAPSDVLGILPTVASTFWMIQEADGWDPEDHTADLVFYNPGTVAAPVKIDETEFDVDPGAVVVVPWPGEEAEIDADLPVALFIAHAQTDGCGVTSRIACNTSRPWSVPDLTGWTDVLVSYTPTPW